MQNFSSKKLFFLLTFYLCTATISSAQDLVVIFKEGKSSFANKTSQNLVKNESLSKTFNAFKFSQPQIYNKSSIQREIRKIKRDPNVKYVIEDRPMKQRNVVDLIPTDIFWDKLWGLKDDLFLSKGTNAFDTWKDFGAKVSLKANSKGKQLEANESYSLKERRKNDVVVAIIDSSVDINHEDLKANIFTNSAEVLDGIDNDGNGLVDDIHGYDFGSNSGMHPSPRFHGTHVAGTISAVNNNIGVIGISPNTQVLPLGYNGGLPSSVLKAYEYAYQMKKSYLESNGVKGANIVVTNSSFGYDGSKCDETDYTLFNDIFNKLGSVGIISVVAAPNQNWDVDEVGDVPSGCSSDYIISVSRQDKNGTRYWQAAYGAEQIDLIAPGSGIVSTVPQGSYYSTGGTSMATPHVAGTVAYLHSIASDQFLNEFYDSPEIGALVLKDMILNNTTKEDHLEGIVSSAGRLNLYNSAKAVSNYPNN